MNKCINCGGGYTELVLNDLPMRKCAKCGLIWRRDFDIDAEYYKNEYKIFTSKEKRAERLANAQSRIRLFKKWVRFDNFCDFGCGDGMFLSVLRRWGYNNLIGLEPEPKNSELFDDSKIFSSEQDTTILFKKHAVHTVGLFHVIEHVTNPRNVMQQLYEALPTGGKLIIETPNIDSYIMRKTAFKNKLVYREHLYYFSPSTLRELLTSVGFRTIASGQRNFHGHETLVKRVPTFFKNLFIKVLEREDYIWVVVVK